jgi:nucleolar protein 16
MTSVRKRKMARSSVKKATRRTKDRQRNINIHSNPIIAAHWDKSLTLQQNYKRLGLRAKLGHLAGGQEQHVETLTEMRAKRAAADDVSIEDIANATDAAQIPEGEARLVRDPDTNEVVRVIYGTRKRAAAAPAPADLPVVKQLEEFAQRHLEVKRERKQSERESEWCEALYRKYGDDYDKMKWDRKLNPMQQSAGDLRRRIMKWRAAAK